MSGEERVLAGSENELKGSHLLLARRPPSFLLGPSLWTPLGVIPVASGTVPSFT